MPFDEFKVPVEYADLFYSGNPGEDGEPVGLTDEQWDEQKRRMLDAGVDLPWQKSAE